jgi:GMP synthase PP-ATPase subunit
MTADWVHLPYDFLMKVSNDIINKVKGVIEWYMIWFKTTSND